MIAQFACNFFIRCHVRIVSNDLLYGTLHDVRMEDVLRVASCLDELSIIILHIIHSWKRKMMEALTIFTFE
jgi:hypothetical protein